MSLTKQELYLLKEVFTKVKYDKMNERYYLALEDYGFLNLEGPQISLLKRMCQENNIYLEELPKRLKSRETQQLFKEYNLLKEKIKSNPNVSNKEELESMLYEIRNKIVEGHMRLVYSIINKYIPGIKEMPDKDDIYQIGYETLIEFVDLYDHTKEASFIYFVRTYIIHHIVSNMYANNKNIKKWNKEDLHKLNKIRKKLKKEDKEISIEILSKETGLTIDKIKNLLVLENLMSPTIIPSEEDKLTDDLIDYEFEDRTIKKVLEKNELITKLINNLPSQVKRVIKLYYGFEDGKNYTLDEIALKIGNISSERVRQLKEMGLNLLANFIGSNYLKDIYGPTNYSKQKNEHISLLPESYNLAEELLIGLEPKELLLSIINTLNPVNKEIMLLYYGLKDGTKHDIDEISKILNIRKAIIIERKKTTTHLLIKRIVKSHNPKFEGNYLEYLMNNYLNTPKRKR